MSEISEERLPYHVSIVMDGNGRWAKSRGLERWAGHAEGVQSVRVVLREAAKAGIKILSLYAFSEENWNRSEEEVSALMELMAKSMLAEAELMKAEGVRFVVLGNRGRLSAELNAQIDSTMKATASNTRITMIIFLSYSGKWDIVQATQRIVAEALADPGHAPEVTMDLIRDHLVTASWPDPDLIIRTSGEQRLSNYLLWQAAYSEYYFTPVLWPDFREKEFAAALKEYALRDRRYGKTK